MKCCRNRCKEFGSPWGCHGIKSMTLIRVDDMYNVSPLSWIDTPDISALQDPTVYDTGILDWARLIVQSDWVFFV